MLRRKKKLRRASIPEPNRLLHVQLLHVHCARVSITCLQPLRQKDTIADFHGRPDRRSPASIILIYTTIILAPPDQLWFAGRNLHAILDITPESTDDPHELAPRGGDFLAFAELMADMEILIEGFREP